MKSQPRGRKLPIVPLIAGGFFLAAVASAQTYPLKPVHMVVSYPPGGLHDIVARLVQPAMTKSFGQPVIVENRGGAAGRIAAEAVAKSPNDGYTVLVIGDTLTTIPHLYKSVGYDLFRDFSPVARLAYFPYVLAVHAALPAGTVKAFVALARDKPGSVMYGTPGNGAPNHLAAELFQRQTGIRLVHVPYKGTAQAIRDLAAGQIQAMVVSLTLASTQTGSGKVRILGITSRERSLLAPQIPTFAESGFPEYEAGSFVALFAPAGTPGAIVQRIYAEARKALLLPEVQSKLIQLGGEAAAASAEELAGLVREQYERWGKVIRENNIHAD
ncbi:MAG: tripartite tricarboxylate transporter substrate binding protein [Burkholderiales bacterium]|nr:tripartite tricarboxylate transporter substrate binding protein [Burkholderiales bacterium]